MVEAQDEQDEEKHVLEANEASDDELEAEYQEAVAMMTIAKQRRAEVDQARQFFRKTQSSEERSKRPRNPIHFWSLPFYHTGENGGTTSGLIDTACARTLAGTRWFENLEVELKRHATPVEVVPDNETFRFGPGAVKKSSRAVILPVAVGRNVFLLRASLLDEEVPLLISMGVVKQFGKCN